MRWIAGRTETGARLIAHEIAHVGQFARAGFVLFAARYLAAYAKGRLGGLDHPAAYRQIPFEVEAREAEADAVWRAGIAVKEEPVLASLSLRILPEPGLMTDGSVETFLSSDAEPDDSDPSKD